jgi:PAS domain S-box-containing protein
MLGCPVMTASRPSVLAAADIDMACESLTRLKQAVESSAASWTMGGSLTRLTPHADAVDDGVIFCNDAADILMVNAAAARLTGYSATELQALTVWDITHGASQPDFDVLWREFLRAGRQLGVYTLRTREGEPLDVAYCSEARLAGHLHVAVLRLLTTPARP